MFLRGLLKMKLIIVINVVYSLAVGITGPPTWSTQPSQPSQSVPTYPTVFQTELPYVTFPFTNYQTNNPFNSFYNFQQTANNGLSRDYSGLKESRKNIHNKYPTYGVAQSKERGLRYVAATNLPYAAPTVSYTTHYNGNNRYPSIGKDNWVSKAPNPSVFKLDYQKFFEDLGLDDHSSSGARSSFTEGKPAYYNEFFQPIIYGTEIPVQDIHLRNHQLIHDDNNKSKKLGLQNNYRDDKTHEYHTNHDSERDNPTEEEEAERSEEEKAPISDHEYPLQIPTRPIYPGEGHWAKPGVKHRPYVSNQKFASLENDSEERPDGFDTFEQGEKIFRNQQQVFQEGIKNVSPERFKFDESSESDEQGVEGKTDYSDSFIPTKTYAQVRKTEEELHLPVDKDEPRLREVINDSKIQTVYTEEGYEDSAYDHAGHEKSAETDEGNHHKLKKSKTIKPKKYYSDRYIEPDGEGSESSEVYRTISFIQENARLYAAGRDSEQIDSNTAGTEDRPTNSNNKRFAKTEELKTTEVKDMGSGDASFRISSEVKIVTNPDNRTTSHKYVKIYPKDFTVQDGGNPAKANTVRVKRYSLKQDKIRPKRFINDLPTIKTDTEFIDKIKIELPKHINKYEETHIKYPYYTAKDLPKNSPLRYAEDLRNVPVKLPGSMAFYDQANQRKDCQEVQTDIDPIPDRIKNGEHEEGSGNVEELAESPRLRNLGDKIDCFKVKYFGENPLDSPFFKEEYIDSPEPLYQAFDSSNYLTESSPETSASEIYSKIVKENEIIENNKPSPTEKYSAAALPQYNYSEMRENPEAAKIRESDPTKIPVISLITTPSYTVKLTPRHIYDQIHLLNYLPTRNTISEPVSTEVPSTINEEESMATTIPIINDKINHRQGKELSQHSSQGAADNANPVSLPVSEEMTLVINDRKNDASENLEATPVPIVALDETKNSEENMPHSQPLRKRRRHKRPRPQTNLFGIFDINDFLPPPLPSQFSFVESATILPKYKTVSEVHYKDDIKPNEQLNVFEDVINNIRTASTEPTMQEPVIQKTSATDVQSKLPIRRIKKNKTTVRKIRIKDPIKDSQLAGSDSIHEVNQFEVEDGATIVYPQFGVRKPVHSTLSESSNNQHRYISLNAHPQRHSEKVHKPVGHLSIPVTQTSIKNPVSEDLDLIKTTTTPNGDHTEESETEVFGLVPPGNWQYKTIYTTGASTKRPNSVYFVLDEKLNTFPVIGMKPPPLKRAISYDNYRMPSNIRRTIPKHRIEKRSALRPRYSEIRRNSSANTRHTDASDDDYIPNRSRNFRYDSQQDKIIYNRQSYDADQSNAHDSSVATQKSTTATVTNPATTKAPEMKWFEYIKLLKSNGNYQIIAEPEKAENSQHQISRQKQQESATAQVTTTTTPEYLRFIAQLKSNSNYKVIEEKRQEKQSTTTESVPLDVEVEAEESIEYKNIQNSPHEQTANGERRLVEISEVSESTTNVKSYMPKTTIDISKYINIERHSPRKNTSIHQNLEAIESQVVDKRIDDVIPDYAANNPTTESTTISTDLTSPTPDTNSTTKISQNPSKTNRMMNSKMSGTLRLHSLTKSSPSTSTTLALAKSRKPNLYTRTTTPKPETTTKSSDNQTTRSFLRRRWNRTHTQTTTETYFGELKSQYKNKTITKRHQVEEVRDIPVNHKTVFTPITQPTPSTLSNSTENDNNQVNVKLTPRTVTAEILYQTENLTAPYKKNFRRHEIRVRKVADVDISNNYNFQQKDGHNYEQALNLKNAENEKEKLSFADSSNDSGSEQTIKQSNNYRENKKQDPNQSKEPVEIIFEYDRTRKHGGNYKYNDGEERTSATAGDTVVPKKSQSLNISKPDAIHRSGFRSKPIRMMETANIATEVLKNVEIISDYDKTRKHGGNYKSDEEASIESEVTGVAEETAMPTISNSNKLGAIRRGNYGRKSSRTIEDTQRNSEKIISADTHAPKEVEIIKDYNESKKHGGNYKSEEEIIEDDLIDSDVAVIAEETTVPKVSQVPIPNKIRRNLRRKSNNTKEAAMHSTKFIISTTESVKENMKKIDPFEILQNQRGNSKLQDQIENIDALIVSNETTARVTSAPTNSNKIRMPFIRKQLNNRETTNKAKTQGTESEKTEEGLELVSDNSQIHEENYKVEIDDATDNITNFELLQGTSPPKPLNVDKVENMQRQTSRRTQQRRKENILQNTIAKSNVTKPKYVVDVISDYDESKKYGGNYKNEHESSANSNIMDKINTSVEKTTRDKNYVPRQQRMYIRQRRVNIVEKDISTAKPEDIPQEKQDHVDVFKDYNKSQKHGGNYRRISQLLDKSNSNNTNNGPKKLKERVMLERKKLEGIEIFAKYNKSLRIGGNYRRNNIRTTTSKPESGNYIPPTTYEIKYSDEIKKLSDIVPKPFSFYTDSQLPENINQLKEDDIIMKTEKSAEDEISADNLSGDTLDEYVDEEEAVPTKKPLFIKDPSKRLYFYAPVK